MRQLRENRRVGKTEKKGSIGKIRERKRNIREGKGRREDT